MDIPIGRLRSRWKLWLGAVAIGLGSIAFLLTLSQRHNFHGDCVPPRSVDALGPRIYDNHQAVTVSRGSIVTVQLVASANEAWPWRTPRGSDETVLQSVPLCFDPTNVSSLPVQMTPFKAVASGKTVITADTLNGDTARDFVLLVTVTP